MTNNTAAYFKAISQQAELHRAMQQDGVTAIPWLQQDLIRYLQGQPGRDDAGLASQLATHLPLRKRYLALLQAYGSIAAPAAAAAADLVTQQMSRHMAQRETDSFKLQLTQARQRPQTYVSLTLLQPLAGDGVSPVLHLLSDPPQRLIFSPLSEGKAQLLLENNDSRLSLLLSCPLQLVL